MQFNTYALHRQVFHAACHLVHERRQVARRQNVRLSVCIAVMPIYSENKKKDNVVKMMVLYTTIRFDLFCSKRNLKL